MSVMVLPLARAMNGGGKLPELTDEQFRVVENLSHILVRKILRAPLQRTVEAAHTPDEAQVVRELQNVFKLDIKE